MKKDAAPRGPLRAKQATLADLDAALETNGKLDSVRRRDLRSAARRVARLLGEEPAQIPLDLPTISRRLAACMPAAAGLSQKTFANLKSDFLAGLRAAGFGWPRCPAKAPMSPGWRKLMRGLSSKRMHLGLSRLAKWCSANGLEPAQVNDRVIADFIGAIRQGTLHRKPNELHRNVSQIWNEAARIARCRLRRVTVPSFRQPVRRLDWSVFRESFQNDLDAYARWSGGSDPFAADARSRALAPQTIQLQRNHVRAALTALVESGISPSKVTSLADLVAFENVQRIVRRRHEMVGGQENVFNHDLARTLIEIARRWVKLEDKALEELKKLARTVPTPQSGLTKKNKARLRQFDDPANLLRLVDLPDRLWAEVKRDKLPNFRTVLKAQAAIAIGILTCMPVRPQNLWPLKFDEHVFLKEGWGAISSLELPAGEVKNRVEMAFDFPPHLAKMLIEYRSRLVPKVIGKRPDRLFIKADGSAKNQWAVSWLIRTVLRRRAGLQLSAHGFRHLSAKTILDREPGNFETVRQLLGHKTLRTTVSAYAGIDSRRAGRHHQHLLDQALAQGGRPPRRANGKKKR